MFATCQICSFNIYIDQLRLELDCLLICNHNIITFIKLTLVESLVGVQAKPETVKKVSEIVKKQLALPDDSTVDGESKFAALGADSLDTVNRYLTQVP